ncbi:major facilitator superfamily domain-containing protein [Massariosphaeria phaeospora]|uniref:Major facilitator superfamily domain-containing protein n=1 Tax=Massariosphaeria phaeospora TaxID=100035 RepID=A0A7C8I6D5_9PLEO|nr:major facilitator superfamily domain-containing protein [Massariosphaeria phaeospora]
MAETAKKPLDVAIPEAGKFGFQGDDVAIALHQYSPGSALEKTTLRKVDLYQIPMLWIMCVMAYVDRSNIGNANAAGMSDDIGLSDNNYSLLMSLFFVGYLIWEVPSNMILYRISPSWYLSCLMAVWCAICCAMSKVRNDRDMIVARFFSGMVEAGFFPGVLSNEIGKRFSLFYTAICFAGAASGLVAGAVITGLEGKNGMQGLRIYVFIVMYIAQNSATSITYFVPTVLKSMGYKGTAVQWMTIPIWAVGTAVLLVLPHTSDKYRERRWHIVGSLTVAWISAIIGLTVEGHDKLRYAFMCLYIGGLYPTAPLILSWASETLALPAEKRAVSIAVINSIGVCSAIYSSYFWPSADAPRYTMDFACVVSFIGISIITAALAPVIFRVLPKYTTRAGRELYAENELERERDARQI